MVYSAAVTITTAEQVAMNWYSERNDKVSNDFRIVESFIEKENTENIYFIFNFDKTGFVMVSADDATIPILGYVFEHNYTLENHPPQFDAMLASFKEQIVYAKENNLSASKEAKDEWERLNVRTENFEINRDFNRLGPLLSSLWNQNYSWNTYCPPDTGGPGGYVYAGCVAVAMAQIMNYWGHPTTGTGSHSYSCPPYGTLSADFGATTYNFPMNNTTPDNDIRELLYHCGVSVEMQYGPGGSGAYTSDVVSALETYFDYDTSAYYDQKANYTNTVWENMIRDNLDDGRPLQYRGSGTGGHSFNLDGYHVSDDSYFHFNWGWSGSYNGYYYLSSLNPGTANFTSGQAAIFDIFPVSGGVVDTLSYYPDITYYFGVPDVNNISKFGVYFTPADACDLTKIKAYFYGTAGTPTSCDLKIYDALVDTSNGKEYPNNLLHTENIPISSIPPTGWSEQEIVLTSPIHFDSGENFFIIYEIVGVYNTDQVNLLRSAGSAGEGTHSVCEYLGSWYYHIDLWTTPFEMAMDAVVEYAAAIPPTLVISPLSIDFQRTAINGYKTQIVTLANVGGGQVVINGVTIAGNPQIVLYDTNSYPDTLFSGESISFLVTYGPDAVGTNSADITISETSSRADHSIPITGEGYNHNSWASGSPVFDQPPTGNQGDYSWSMVTSDAAPNYLHAENFWSIPQPITAIEFWGINWYYDGGWHQSDVEDPMTFEIKFYEDHVTEYSPATEVASFSIPLSRTLVDTVTFSSGPVYKYRAEFLTSVTLTDGWVSIRGTSVSSPIDPWFLWSTSPVGDLGNVTYDYGNSEWDFDDVDLAFALYTNVLLPPADVAVSISGSDAIVSWTPEAGRNYNVYSDSDPYGSFSTLAGTVTDGSGSFTDPIGLDQLKFYRVTTATYQVRDFMKAAPALYKSKFIRSIEDSILMNGNELKK
ncbi:MAG: C10 family peptidase, partial [Candidatus Cloacimonetes bacterium]|nr:C10 family peptidase [Candidatus Cloacimonadota bacterium]